MRSRTPHSTPAYRRSASAARAARTEWARYVEAARALATRLPEERFLELRYEELIGPVVYRRDIERIYLRAWLYAGHQSEIPMKGDYFVYELAGESV